MEKSVTFDHCAICCERTILDDHNTCGICAEIGRRLEAAAPNLLNALGLTLQIIEDDYELSQGKCDFLEIDWSNWVHAIATAKAAISEATKG